MHDGTAQDPQAARALVARARSVLIRLTSDVFGVDLLNLRVTEFITSRRLRHALREADKRNVEGSYAQVASIAVWSFEFLMSRWSRFVASLAEGKSARTESPEPVVAAVSAGVHILDLKRFRDATDQVVSHMTLDPARPDAAAVDAASADPSLVAEVKRATLAGLVAAGAGDSAVLNVVDAIRRCVAVEKYRPSGTISAALGGLSPIGPYALRFEVVGRTELFGELAPARRRLPHRGHFAGSTGCHVAPQRVSC